MRTLNSLSAADRKRLLSIACLTGEWYASQAAEVAGADIRTIDSCLSRAVSTGLVEPTLDRLGRFAYSFARGVQDCFHSSANGRVTADRSRANHQECFFRLAARSRVELTGHQQTEWLETLRTSYKNVYAAIIAGIEGLGPAEETLKCLSDMSIYWLRQGLIASSYDLVCEACDKFGTTECSALARAMNVKAALSLELGELDQAQACYSQAIRIASACGDLLCVGMATSNLCLLYRAKGDLHGAVEFAASAVVAMRNLGDVDRLLKAMVNLGATQDDLGQYEEAKSVLHEARRIAIAADCVWIISMIDCNLGEVDLHQGNVADAVLKLSVCALNASKTGDRRLSAASLDGLTCAMAATHHELAVIAKALADRFRGDIGLARYRGMSSAIRMATVACLNELGQAKVASLERTAETIDTPELIAMISKTFKISLPSGAESYKI